MIAGNNYFNRFFVDEILNEYSGEAKSESLFAAVYNKFSDRLFNRTSTPIKIGKIPPDPLDSRGYDKLVLKAIHEDIAPFKESAPPCTGFVVGDTSVDVRLIPSYIDSDMPTVAQAEIFGSSLFSFGGAALVADLIRGYCDHQRLKEGNVDKYTENCFILSDRFLVKPERQSDIMPTLRAIYKQFPSATKKDGKSRDVWRIERHLGIVLPFEAQNEQNERDAWFKKVDGPSPYLACLSRVYARLSLDLGTVEVETNLLVVVDSQWGGKERFFDALLSIGSSGLQPCGSTLLSPEVNVNFNTQYLIHKYKNRSGISSEGKSKHWLADESFTAENCETFTDENKHNGRSVFQYKDQQGKVLHVKSCRSCLVISANELRRDGIFVSYRMSWERTVQTIINWCVVNDEIFKKYCDVVISFGPNGALFISREEAIQGQTELQVGSFSRGFLVTKPDEIEGDVFAMQPGKLRGPESLLVAALAAGFISTKDEDKEHGLCFENAKNWVLKGVEAAIELYKNGETSRDDEPNWLYSKFTRSISEWNTYNSENRAKPAKYDLFYPIRETAEILAKPEAEVTKELIILNIPTKVFTCANKAKFRNKFA